MLIALLPSTLTVPRLVFLYVNDNLSPIILSTAGFAILSVVNLLLPARSDHNP